MPPTLVESGLLCHQTWWTLEGNDNDTRNDTSDNDNNNVVAVGPSPKRPRRESRARPSHPADALEPTTPSGSQRGIRDM